MVITTLSFLQCARACMQALEEEHAGYKAMHIFIATQYS